MITQARRRFAEERPGVGGLHRRVRVLARARSLERIAAGPDLALQIAGLAADAVEVFEAVEVRLEFFVRDTPILARAIGSELVLAIAHERAAPRLEVPRQKAPSHAV